MSLFIKLFSGFAFSLLVTFSCKHDAGNSSSDNASNTIAKPANQNFMIKSPAENATFTIGQGISIDYSFKDSLKLADSITFRINGRKLSHQNKPYKPFRWETKEELPGIKSVTLTAYYRDSTVESRHVKISLLSDVKPDLYTVAVVNTYPHDINAYTQGLIFEDGFFYEGTGQTGLSTLRKVHPQTGERLKVLNLPPDIFGEGLASTGKYLYQLTYKTNVAFQYDKATFDLVNKFNFPMKEGWGLTYDGTNLLMTDGTEVVYFLDPEYFTEVRQISVYDDKRPIQNLNELEYIKDEIWANVYTTDTIVRINPQTGKVTGKVVVKDILKQEDYHPNIDYLNGIAYDKETDRLFITGKNWPKLFEIKLVKQ
ncbi:MAG TPA: glutaminyl-peptide cyclotransferase [Bacteroidales bacterium]|nr:glutaminyl-peptide cyclotransferase [Bacteroidales bacterium]